MAKKFKKNISLYTQSQMMALAGTTAGRLLSGEIPTSDAGFNYNKYIDDVAGTTRARLLNSNATYQIHKTIPLTTQSKYGVNSEILNAILDNGVVNRDNTSKIKINDPRNIDSTKRFNYDVSSETVKKLISGARRKGLNPNTVLAIALQETGINPDNPLFNNDLTIDVNAVEKSNNWDMNYHQINNSLDYLKSKMKYAKQLGKTTDADTIQAWNGYGKIKGQDNTEEDSVVPIYGTTKSIDMNKDPVYGKRIIDLRDNVILKNPQIQDMINKEDGGEIMKKKYKIQSKSTGGIIDDVSKTTKALSGIASAIPIVGAGVSLVGTVVDMFAAKKEEERLKKEEQLLADKNAMAAMGTGLAKGGEIKGKGTGTSDSIPAKLEKGDFIVPAKNAETAMKIRNEHFGDVENKTALKDGDVPVNVSDGEVRFTKDEMDYLDEIGEGSSVRKLTPNATEPIKPGGKYGSGTKDKVVAKPLTPEEQQLLINKRNLDWTRKMTINSNRTSNELLKPYMGGKQLDWNNPITPKVQTTLAKTIPYTPLGKSSSKFGKFTTENAGAILGAGQAIAGLIQGAKNAKQERNLKPIQSNAAITNSEAIETKMTADRAANAIMAGNTAEADRATGNYMRMAKEAGGANSATVLANASRVGQSSSDSYLKGMTTAAQLRMAGQQAGSEMKIKAGEQATQVAQYNDMTTRRLLEAKSANANNLLGAGLQNTGMALARADYNKKMAELKATTEHNLTGTKTSATTPTVSTTTPATTTITTPTTNTTPSVSVATGSTISNTDVPSKNTTPSAWDIEQMSEMERLKKGLYPGMKKGGLVKKYKKSKILSYGR